MNTARLSQVDAAYTIVALLDTPLVAPLPDARSDAAFGAWLSVALDRYDLLSSGEQVVFNAALAVWNGHRVCRLADLGRVDQSTRATILDVLARCWG